MIRKTTKQGTKQRPSLRILVRMSESMNGSRILLHYIASCTLSMMVNVVKRNLVEKRVWLFDIKFNMAVQIEQTP